MSGTEITIDGRTIGLSHRDKILFPDTRMTKGDLISYYRRIAPVMLPHLRDRPVTQHRFPDGIDEEGFYQKRAVSALPGWIPRAAIDLVEGGSEEMLLCSERATLVYLAQLACITPHVWLSRVDRPRQPDRIVIDLDPPDDAFDPVRTAARWIHDTLDRMEVDSYAMLTGSRGMHVVLPLKRGPTFDDTRAFADDLAGYLEERHPRDLTNETRKDKRGGRLYLDTQRNAYGQTVAAPYAVRPRPGAPVATPIDWNELTAGVTSSHYTVATIFRRLGQKTDPWHTIDRHAAELSALVRGLRRLQKGK